MKMVKFLSLAALLIMVVGIPVYGVFEPIRMSLSQDAMRQQYLEDAMDVYIRNCALCHGADGAGLGMMPALDRDALRDADADMLFETIARAAHGATMAAWHVEEGGILSDYQINELVTLLQHADWTQVRRLADKVGFQPSVQPAIETGTSYLQTEDSSDPHQCVDCHEEPPQHADIFGVNCGRCHDTLAWAPATLTRHNFSLEHGGMGVVACETCHATSYVKYDCYACHTDHQAAEMEVVHQAENIYEYSDCILCHPTGAAGEAEQYRRNQPGLQGEADDISKKLFATVPGH